MSAKGDYYPVGPNMWVPNMAYAADVAIEGKLQCLLTPIAPVAASATALLNAQSINVAGTATLAIAQTEAVFGKFGRAVQVVASGAATSLVTVHGFDYLGQGMSEQLTLNGATIVNGVKMFRRISSVVYGLTAATTINLGTLDRFGLPYAYIDAGVDFVDGAKAGSQGTYVVAPLTAQTVTSVDPRGYYIPNAASASNGSRKYTLMYEPRRNDLYGLKHFFNG